MSAATEVISSRENALIKTLHKLAHDGGAYRKLGHIWLEGEHLVSSCLQKARRDYALGQQLESARLIVCQSYLPQLPHFLQQYGSARSSARPWQCRLNSAQRRSFGFYASHCAQRRGCALVT